MSDLSSSDITNMAFWFPRIEEAGLPVPKTRMLHTDVELYSLLDGKTPSGYHKFMGELQGCVLDVGMPAFLRTGHGSGKHSWSQTCFVRSIDDLPLHVTTLVDWSGSVDLWGLPVQDWAAREMLKPDVLFRCDGWRGFPVTREFRFFVRDGDIEHIQPYWPPGAISETARPSKPDWYERLAAASELPEMASRDLEALAWRACRAVGGGYWSVDFMDVDGEWFLTDMAEGDKSFDTRNEAR